MKIFANIFIILLFFCSCNQDSKETSKETSLVISKEKIDTNITSDSVIGYIPEFLPEFGNGDEDIKNFFLENIEYPESAIHDSIEGTVYVQFVINVDGSVSNPKIVRGVRDDLDKECIRVVNKMPPWKPARTMVEPVKVQYCIPFSFQFEFCSERCPLITITPKKNINRKNHKMDRQTY